MSSFSFLWYISKEAGVLAPDPGEPIPVTVEVNGEKIKVGEGHIDLESGVFTTTIDPEKADVVKPFLDMEHYRLGVQVTEVKAVKLPGYRDQQRLF